jgi:hypothetical protein
MTQMILDALFETATSYLAAVKAFLPRLVVASTVIFAGWLLAFVLRFLTRRVLALVHFEGLMTRLGAAEILKRGGLPPGEVLAGSLVFWLAFVGFLVSGLEVLGLKGLEGLLAGFLQFVPRLLIAGVILLLGLVAANFVWRATLIAAVNAGLASARLVAGAMRYLVVVLAIAMALEQLALAKTVVLTAFSIAFGGVMLGVALAFGIGGAPLARRILEQQLPEKRETDSDGAAHL